MTLIVKALAKLRPRIPSERCSCIRLLTVPSKEQTIDKSDDDSQDIEKDDRIEKICDKSRLRPEHRNILFSRRPYSEPILKAHYTVKYNRKLYGKFGSSSGVNPGIMWPTKHDLLERKEYEEVAFPHTISELVSAAKKEIEEKEKTKMELENRIIERMQKLEFWKKQLRDTIAKKEAEAVAAKQKKEKLVEEVRRHFGFTVDPKDDRFKEMVALKEKEMKKKERQARLEEKERKALARLMETHKTEIES